MTGRHLQAVTTQDAITYDPAERFITKAELARHLGLSVRWVERQLSRGLPHHRVGGSVRFQLTSALQWLLNTDPELERQR
jgi:phage terminase Nu1 subunit (DNA packaging protein)